MVSFKKLRQMIEVQGNGNIVSREISIGTFVRLHLGCKGIVELHQSEEEKVIVEADENLVDYCVATNAGRTLFVSNTGTLKRPVFTSCVMKIYLRQMNVLYIRNDHGDVVCPGVITLTEPLKVTVQSHGNSELNLQVPALKISSMTHGDVAVKGSTEKLEVKNMSQGNFDSTKLKAGEVIFKNMAEGNVWLHADRAITISHFGQGFIHYSGEAEVKDVKQYGDGAVKRVKLPADDAVSVEK